MTPLKEANAANSPAILRGLVSERGACSAFVGLPSGCLPIGLTLEITPLSSVENVPRWLSLLIAQRYYVALAVLGEVLVQLPTWNNFLLLKSKRIDE